MGILNHNRSSFLACKGMSSVSPNLWSKCVILTVILMPLPMTMSYLRDVDGVLCSYSFYLQDGFDIFLFKHYNDARSSWKSVWDRYRTCKNDCPAWIWAETSYYCRTCPANISPYQSNLRATRKPFQLKNRYISIHCTFWQTLFCVPAPKRCYIKCRWSIRSLTFMSKDP